ncbi:hypothetical protein GCM10028818_06370 [Spirosoma horti]
MSHHINLVRLRAVANALAELNEKVVFVGGATVSLYATDPAASEPRPTEDVDVVVEVATYAEFSRQLDDRLRQLGFVNDIESGIICRYKIRGLIVDIMPTDSSILGFTNRWYEAGVTQSIGYKLDERKSIQIFSAPYFVATKLEALSSFRHGRDLRCNSDFEDIIYLFDNRNELLNELIQSTDSVRSYLREAIAVLLSDANVYENIYAHLEPRTASQRAQRILNIWKRITDQ